MQPKPDADGRPQADPRNDGPQRHREGDHRGQTAPDRRLAAKRLAPLRLDPACRNARYESGQQPRHSPAVIPIFLALLFIELRLFATDESQDADGCSSRENYKSEAAREKPQSHSP
jgi:hypothetical protein